MTVRVRWPRASGALCVGLLLASAAAIAQQSSIYKWTDDRGGVHYSNSPPPEGTKATVLDESNSKVSVVPATKPPDAASAPDPQLQSRVQRLERELEDERRAQAAAAQAQSEAAQRAREECLAQRRTDCDNPYAAPSPVYGYPAPAVIRPPRPVKPIAPAPPKPRMQPPKEEPELLEEPRPGAKIGTDVIRR